MTCKPIHSALLAISASLLSCVGTPEQAETAEQVDAPSSIEVVGIVGDGTSMHVLELITLEGDSMYFTYEVNSTDGIDVGDTITVTYDEALGEGTAIDIRKNH